MQNNQSDKFEQRKYTLYEKETSANSWERESNFFINGTASMQTNKFDQARRLNDYDSNLLEEGAYKDVDDELFKIEYKISKAEENIKILDSQIQAARDISDYDLINELTTRREMLIIELETLILSYNEKSLSAKFSGRISNIFSAQNKKNHFKKFFEKFSNIILSILPKRLSSVLELKRSLTKLENINKSVDELMSFKAPYGENLNKYEQLSKYIIKANSIQAKISNHIK